MDGHTAQRLRRDDPRGLAHALTVQLKNNISEGRTCPGDKVPSEAELGKIYSVSRTVVREAISQLRAEGLIETFQGRGSFVARPPVQDTPGIPPADGPRFGLLTIDLSTIRDVHDLTELRLGIEPQSSALAAVRHSPEDILRIDRALSDFNHGVESRASTIAADFEIHMSIANASGNPFISSLMSAIGSQAVFLQRLNLHEDINPISTEHTQLVQVEHRQIRDAIAANDQERARAAMFNHLSRSLSSVSRS